MRARRVRVRLTCCTDRSGKVSEEDRAVSNRARE